MSGALGGLWIVDAGTLSPAGLALSGLALGLVFGALIASTNFCAMGGVADLMLFGDTRRLRAWVLAGLTAIVGVQALAAAGIVMPARSHYLAAEVSWVGHVAGGLLFGVGMVLAGGCVSRNLARAGAGDLRAGLVLLAFAFFVRIVSTGVASPFRLQVERAFAVHLSVPTQSLGDLVAGGFGVARAAADGAIGMAVVGGGLIWCLSSRTFRQSYVHLAAGSGIGLLVVWGWLVTTLGHDPLALEPQSAGSLTFVGPVAAAFDALAFSDRLGWPAFDVMVVVGTLLGSTVYACTKGRFRLVTFASAGDTLRGLGGAALMAAGGVMAHGCTIGQGVTGVSTLAVGSLLTLVSLVLGGMIGVRLLEHWHASDV